MAESKIEDMSSAIAKMSYEDARDALAEVVQKLEVGGATLEDSLTLWERGEALANHCEAQLTKARKRLSDARSQNEPGES